MNKLPSIEALHFNLQEMHSLLRNMPASEHRDAVIGYIDRTIGIVESMREPYLEAQGPLSAYVEYAQANLQREGELEIDDGALVSKGDDDGAYVQAWVWVNDEDAGIESDDKDSDEDDEDPDHSISCGDPYGTIADFKDFSASQLGL